MVVQVVTVAFGVLLIVGVLVDLVSTTVGVSGGSGPLTARLTSRLWGGLSWLFRRTGSRRVLQAAGPVVLFAVLLVWVLLLVAGWGLVLSPRQLADPGGAGQAVSLGDQLYYAGSTVLGRGSPPLRPDGGLWRFMEQTAGLTGVVFISLLIAYVLPVVSAVVNGRQVAAYISTLGHTPRQMLDRAWNGQDFGNLPLHLIALAPMVVDQGERHLAHPVLFYFHSLERHSSLAASLVAVDEAVTIVDCCHEQRLQESSIVPLRVALSEFLDTLRHAFIVASETAPPVPDLTDLRDRDVPFIDDVDVDEAFGDIAERRRLLRALLGHAGWRWQDIETGPGDGPVRMTVDRIGLRDPR